MPTKFKVDSWNNFCRVFELPNKFPTDFCFGGGINCTFKLVDWFYPESSVNQAGVSKEVWINEVGPIEQKEVTTEELEEKIIPFLQDKIYVKPNKTYLVICDFGLCFTFTKK